jgi:sulfofructosephosphate aldolase
MTYPEAPALDPIARGGGGLAMVAMDQRESLRHMFDTAGAGRPGDDVLVQFKHHVATALGPLASGFLIDRHFGFESIRRETVLPEGTGLILAADALDQEDGGPVEETSLDNAVVDPDFDLGGVAAIKLLIIWRRDEKRQARIQLAKDFVEAARTRGVLSVLEPVVRATAGECQDGTWDTDEAIREAARELSGLGQSLYKVQVPLGGRGNAAEQHAASLELGRSITGPWVVLSQGVAQGDFAAAVKAACRGGASGFLAGRALWSDVVGEPDVPAMLQKRSIPRLEHLVELVDREARPWQEAS